MSCIARVIIVDTVHIKLSTFVDVVEGCTNRSAGAGYDYIANYSSPQTKNTAIYNFADWGSFQSV